jgi:Asp-tRNA(Asn)/Glu-tRNA(Gln) amidotransferase A subunit family amidase
MPVGVKDIMETADMPTEQSSPLRGGSFDLYSASCTTVLAASLGRA